MYSLLSIFINNVMIFLCMLIETGMAAAVHDGEITRILRPVMSRKHFFVLQLVI